MERDQQIQNAAINSAVAFALFEKLGFEIANKSTLPSKLKSISPTGATAMRDAVMLAITTMIELYGVIAKLGGAKVWNFVHVVLTDGEDTSSRTTLDDACKVMFLIGQTLPIQMLKTFFIGVDLQYNSQAAKELATLAACGGENAEFMKVSDIDISNIFEKIKLSLGIIERSRVIGVSDGRNAAVAVQKQSAAYLMMEKQRYVVLFTLDMSGSMSGSRWRRVCDSVSQFVNHLGGEDLVGAIVFNDTCRLVLNYIPSNSSYLPVSNYNQNYNYQYNYDANYNTNNYQQPLLQSNQSSQNGCTSKKVCTVIGTIILIVLVIWLVVYLIN
jgi:hypothetical protein